MVDANTLTFFGSMSDSSVVHNWHMVRATGVCDMHGNGISRSRTRLVGTTGCDSCSELLTRREDQKGSSGIRVPLQHGSCGDQEGVVHRYHFRK
jgi:hypothetical protein